MSAIAIPSKASTILRVLHEAGYEAYIVGGCVRDGLLGRVPGDWDITTSATPQEVKALFKRTIDTGIQHGTVTVMMGREGFEVTTYRTDGVYSDARHPDSVSFTTSLEEDLKRRDFTVNAMAYAPKEGIIDPFGGLDDLAARTIRAVGDPMERFDEDALRILRAVRFSAQLDFAIEPATRAAITAFAPRLHLISKERIHDELCKLLLSDHPEYFHLFYECGITREIFPWYDEMMATPQNTPFHCYNVAEHTLKVLAATPKDLIFRLTGLLHDIGKPVTRTTDASGQDHFKNHGDVGAEVAEGILREYRFDNHTIETVSRLIEWHDDRLRTPSPAAMRRQISRIGEDIYPMFLLFTEADNAGKSPFAQEVFPAYNERVHELYAQILAEKNCLSLKDLAVKGADLIAAGMKPGPAMGDVLHAMLADVLEEPEHNDKDYLLRTYLP